MVILVTGANGQLGQALKSIESIYPEHKFIFCDSAQLDVTIPQSIADEFLKHKPDYCINAAAYTAVDAAESDRDKAYLINVTGAKNLSQLCEVHGVVLLHLSTDFVFDGVKPSDDCLGYVEEDVPNPINYYGWTKWKGEQEIVQNLKSHYIIRTSWVYSDFGSNFHKTMLRLAKTHTSLKVVSDQIGCPTHAVDLAKKLLCVIDHDASNFGIYHITGDVVCSWYDFAKSIFSTNGIDIDVQAIPSASYPTPAIRPLYSVLSNKKFKEQFDCLNR